MEKFLIVLLQCSISMSLVTLAYAAILPLLSKRYAAKWRYMVWLVIAAGWLLPFRPQIDLTFLPVRMPDIPVTPIQPNFNVTPVTYAGDIANVPATIPLWWVITAIWILGVISVVLYHALRHGRFMKIVRRWSEPVTDLKRLGILDNLKSELGIKIPVRLSVCQGITSPMLVGFFHPVILLPHIRIADDELPLILKHELIHLRRHDLWYKALILAASMLHWFNPVVYLMAKATAVQCEISCDALVLQNADFGQRKQYGETIIGVVRNGAKLQTALSTNFYGGKKGMKNRISSIMDTKQKKAGVAVLCVVLVGIVMTGATLAATTDKGPTTGYVILAEENIETPKSKVETFAVYEQYGLTYNKGIDQLFYNGELVRYFEDWYPIGDGGSAGRDFLNENGTIDVHGVRDLSQLTHNSDGSFDPSGKLIGVEPYSQEEFDAREIEELKNPPMQETLVYESSTADNFSAAQELSQGSQESTTQIYYSSEDMMTPDELAKEYSVYEPFGLTYDKGKDCFYYNGKLVQQFVDVLASNGEAFSSGKFKGAMRQVGSPDGEIEIKAVRDYMKPDANGYGTLTGIEVVK